MKFKRKTFSRSVVSSLPSKRLAILATAKRWISTQRTRRNRKEDTVQTQSSQTPTMKNGKNSNKSLRSWKLTRRTRTRSADSVGSLELPQKILCLEHASARVQWAIFISSAWRSGWTWSDSRKIQPTSPHSSGKRSNAKSARVLILWWLKPWTKGRRTSTI